MALHNPPAVREDSCNKAGKKALLRKRLFFAIGFRKACAVREGRVDSATREGVGLVVDR
jgi:hypothetical protein